MSRWREMLGVEEEPEVEEVAEEVVEEVEEPKPQYMSAEAVQLMLDNQAKQMSTHFESLVSGLGNALTPKQQAQQVEAPSDEEMAEAIESGNTKLYLQLQKKKDAAWASIIDNRMRGVEESHAAELHEMKSRLAENVVPDDYKSEVAAMAEEYGLNAELRTNPKVLELLTNAAKGKNLDKEMAKRDEQAKRAANLDPVGDTGHSTRTQTHQDTRQPIFSAGAFNALNEGGKDKDAFARGIGYADFAEYEKDCAALQDQDVVTHKWMKNAKKGKRA